MPTGNADVTGAVVLYLLQAIIFVRKRVAPNPVDVCDKKSVKEQ